MQKEKFIKDKKDNIVILNGNDYVKIANIKNKIKDVSLGTINQVKNLDIKEMDKYLTNKKTKFNQISQFNIKNELIINNVLIEKKVFNVKDLYIYNFNDNIVLSKKEISLKDFLDENYSLYKIIIGSWVCIYDMYYYKLLKFYIVEILKKINKKYKSKAKLMLYTILNEFEENIIQESNNKKLKLIKFSDVIETFFNKNAMQYIKKYSEDIIYDEIIKIINEIKKNKEIFACNIKINDEELTRIFINKNKSIIFIPLGKYLKEIIKYENM